MKSKLEKSLTGSMVLRRSSVQDDNRRVQSNLYVAMCWSSGERCDCASPRRSSLTSLQNRKGIKNCVHLSECARSSLGFFDDWLQRTQ